MPPPPLRPTHLVVNLAQLRRNLEAIRAWVNPAKVLVMLKANAYGHGVDGVAPFIEPYMDYAGVATLEEGVYLRTLGIKKPILVTGGTLPNQLPWFFEHDLTLTVSSPELLQTAERLAEAAGKPLKVHLKIDTGMERFGVPWDSAEPLLDEALRLRQIEVEGIYTHFANAEKIELPGALRKPGFTYASEQLERFNQVLAFYQKRGAPLPALRHVANSAAVLNLPAGNFDMVRTGIMFYGIYPEQDADRSIEVHPALSWKSQVAYSKVIPPGQGVSYGSLWQSDHPTRIVTLPCGYGDGYSRRMSNQAQVIIKGRRYPQVGRICMDYFMVNLEQDQVQIGEQVILLGDGDNGERITVEELAGWAGTNTYEVLTSIGARVPRVFVQE
jgi:alanine racemase